MKWSCWHSERKIDPFASVLSAVLVFLAKLFEKKYEYNSIDCHRSAMLAYRALMNKTLVVKHPRFCVLMNGIFNSPPPKPRLCFL